MPVTSVFESAVRFRVSFEGVWMEWTPPARRRIVRLM